LCGLRKCSITRSVYTLVTYLEGRNGSQALDDFRKDLEEVLSAFRTLQKIPTKDVKPTLHPVERSDVLREDRVEPSIPREKLLKNLKNTEKGYIKGPRVV